MLKTITQFIKPGLGYRKFSADRSKMVRFITQQEAKKIDDELFNVYKYSLDQLMELAGLSCSIAIYKCYSDKKNILICCGPGNNGGDGLVIARHLKHYGFEPHIYYPKHSENPVLQNLSFQCKGLKIPFINDLPDIDDFDENYQLVVDALFGFSFKPPIREEFEQITTYLAITKVPICSIDIPSGWDVDNGPHSNSFQPEMLISLTAPKKCAESFAGRYHYLAGRFIPPELSAKYKLDLVKFPGSDCIFSLK